MADERDDTGGPFGALFGKSERTAEERENDRREWDRRRNEDAEKAFEKERDRRADCLHMDQRIRNIVSAEINKLIMVGFVIAMVYGLGGQYGWPAGVAVLMVAFALYWWEDRKAQKLPRYKIDEVDRLAEDTVTHERIVAYEREGKAWLWAKGEYLHWEGFFNHPYWEDVNKRVRAYVGMSHQKRAADNKAARAASLSFRKAMIVRLREQDAEWELPAWAWLDFEERA